TNRPEQVGAIAHRTTVSPAIIRVRDPAMQAEPYCCKALAAITALATYDEVLFTDVDVILQHDPASWAFGHDTMMVSQDVFNLFNECMLHVWYPRQTDQGEPGVNTGLWSVARPHMAHALIPWYQEMTTRIACGTWPTPPTLNDQPLLNKLWFEGKAEIGLFPKDRISYPSTLDWPGNTGDPWAVHCCGVDDREAMMRQALPNAELTVWDLGGTPQYNQPLGRALIRQGANYQEAQQWRSVPWLEQNAHPRSVLHVHFPSYLYQNSDHASAERRIAGWELWLRYAKRLGYTVVWTAHNILPHEPLHPDLEMAARRMLCHYSDAVIAHCEWAATQVTHLFAPDAQCTVIPHGPLQDDYPVVDRSTARQRLSIDNNEFVFLHTGNLRTYKNIEGLVETFREVADRTGSRLIIAGRPWPNMTERLTDLSSGDSRITVMLGWIDNNRLAELFAAADIAVFPYKTITTSGSVVLAGSLGTPVVAPALGCIPESAAPNSIISYDPADSNGLRRAMKTALNADLTPLRTAAQHWTGASWDKIAARTMDVYRQAITSACRRVPQL
ncbi:glycosyltransferase family 4 protein, partial [Streptomyces klenkii]|uniref:glycosyltransferase family 4 protein n=1 Tax=Streptomyces klenkii TaxID=1420899 RepID=UPI0033AEC072